MKSEVQAQTTVNMHIILHVLVFLTFEAFTKKLHIKSRCIFCNQTLKHLWKNAIPIFRHGYMLLPIMQSSLGLVKGFGR